MYGVSGKRGTCKKKRGVERVSKEKKKNPLSLSVSFFSLSLSPLQRQPSPY
jgi:hypothetical protein